MENAEEKAKRVAADIEALLAKEGMVLFPTISLQELPKESPIITP